MSNITYYDWVPFFESICRSIHSIAQDAENRDNQLIYKAILTFGEDKAILKYGIIDPFSFVYALAQRNTRNQRGLIFSNARSAFDLEVDIPSDTIFPTPTPNTLSLFHAGDSYITKSNEVIGNECLWNLFSQVYSGSEINEVDFRKALSLKNVGFTKLSQAMFLINSKKYMPFDTQMNSLPIQGLEDLKLVVPKIEQQGVSVYLNAIEKLKAAFEGCELYEVNLLNVLINSNDLDQLRISKRYFQVSTWVNGQNEDDYFTEFISNNAVWTGGPASTSGDQVYPLVAVKRGDIILIRRGTKHLGGIALVLYNEYSPSGYDEDKAIKILWLVKKATWVGDALGQRIGFSSASEKTYSKFLEAYPTTFSILNEIRKKQQVMTNHSAEKHKNLILQGPPGTGKTRLAKQIAEWLTDETETKTSLIRAIDSKIFTKEPEIEGNEQVKLIQFHPSYTYEDFVRGIRVNTDTGEAKYEVVNRILARFAVEASKPENSGKAYVLIIDEINRANLTSVLGELIYALEYRGKNVDSMYAYKRSNEISLPHNLYIIGTMNTADRSVSHIDYAIRRRFTFVPVLPDETAISQPRAKLLFSQVEQLFNEYTSPEFNKNDIRIGHSYFLVEDSELDMKLKYEIKPLLFEYIKDGVLLEAAKDKVSGLHV